MLWLRCVKGYRTGMKVSLQLIFAVFSISKL